MISMILRKNKSQKGIAYIKSGKGDPIILIHGLGLSAECWYKQISFLKKDYTVYALDLPGPVSYTHLTLPTNREV